MVLQRGPQTLGDLVTIVTCILGEFVSNLVPYNKSLPVIEWYNFGEDGERVMKIWGRCDIRGHLVVPRA